jgi:hypothetical protein
LALSSNQTLQSGVDLSVELPATEAEARTKAIPLPSLQTMQKVHFASEASFLDQPNFGYIRNRKQVAGFIPHAVFRTPRINAHISRPWYTKAKELWAIHRMELVSLLKHDEPAVYVSRNVPSMEELRDAKTRSLGEFEHPALQRLRNGEDVVTKSSLNRIEMLGSLRATNQCLECHSVTRGTLLGAFSYEFLRDPAIQTDEPEFGG